jgi:outer membrane protein
MKHTIRNSILILAVIAAVALPASTQAQGKIATINLRKVFDNYYKTKQADTLLKDEAGELDKQRKSMVEDWRKMDTEFKALIDKANDQAISADERAKNKAAAEKKNAEMKEIEQGVAEFDRRSRNRLAEKEHLKRQDLLKEIQAVVETKAKAAGVALVIDTASESANMTPIVVYSNGENDITEVVLTQLNSTAPLTPIDSTPSSSSNKITSTNSPVKSTR